MLVNTGLRFYGANRKPEKPVLKIGEIVPSSPAEWTRKLSFGLLRLYMGYKLGTDNNPNLALIIRCKQPLSSAFYQKLREKEISTQEIAGEILTARLKMGALEFLGQQDEVISMSGGLDTLKR